MEQVMCVDGTPRNGRWSGDPVFKGEIYTVRGMDTRIPTDLGYLLEEAATHEICKIHNTEIGFLASRFVPIRDENLEIFRAMDRKIFKRKKVRA